MMSSMQLGSTEPGWSHASSPGFAQAAVNKVLCKAEYLVSGVWLAHRKACANAALIAPPPT
eukprot:CAMPEP_0206548024 /NCGR_PEP_ID=MMETSP0325_2-20121206/13641_1 /ASSEMBLY_ACC=CAM_ASM_000347 /TAXON_ID=2866 /ORGANISM="Crypthecodinium cohnii, Strain Seligo" /LENGTH=60 /DNA_ID=CAMNT_0054047433 /DNA_START=626 /DNA_END=808 /DNA_ORIENTATION=-